MGRRSYKCSTTHTPKKHIKLMTNNNQCVISIDANSKLPGDAPTLTPSPKLDPKPKQQQPSTKKKPVPLPRHKKRTRISEASTDLDIFSHLGPIKQEEGTSYSLSEYHCAVRKYSTSKSLCKTRIAESDTEEDTTGYTGSGDSGIAEWRGEDLDVLYKLND